MKKIDKIKSGSQKHNDDHFSEESLRDKISKDLRTLYDSVLEESVPDEFLDLLKKADKE